MYFFLKNVEEKGHVADSEGTSSKMNSPPSGSIKTSTKMLSYFKSKTKRNKEEKEKNLNSNDSISKSDLNQNLTTSKSPQDNTNIISLKTDVNESISYQVNKSSESFKI